MKLTNRSFHLMAMVLLLLFIWSCSNQQQTATEESAAAAPAAEEQAGKDSETSNYTEEMMATIQDLQAGEKDNHQELGKHGPCDPAHPTFSHNRFHLR